jgi:hypothetical protein
LVGIPFPRETLEAKDKPQLLVSVLVPLRASELGGLCGRIIYSMYAGLEDVGTVRRTEEVSALLFVPVLQRKSAGPRSE